MKIIAVSTMKDEPDAHLVIEHLRRQGVDEFLISCERGDPIWRLFSQKVSILSVREPFDQGWEITNLAQAAKSYGADWIIPFDADEYICSATDNLTVRDVLLCTKQEIDAILMPMYLHITPQLRAIAPKPLPKIAFRPNDDMTVAWGSHNVNGWTKADYGSLVVRELQYSSWEHLVAKVAKARHLHAQPHMNPEHGSHMVRLTRMTEHELRDYWAQHLATPTVYDPIP